MIPKPRSWVQNGVVWVFWRSRHEIAHSNLAAQAHLCAKSRAPRDSACFQNASRLQTLGMPGVCAESPSSGCFSTPLGVQEWISEGTFSWSSLLSEGEKELGVFCSAQLPPELTLLWGQIQRYIEHLQLPSTFSRNSRRLLDGSAFASLVTAVIPKCLGEIKPVGLVLLQADKRTKLLNPSEIAGRGF